MLLKTGILNGMLEADFADYLVEDHKIRTYLKKTVQRRSCKIEIERASDRVKVIIYTAKPGVVIGKGGAEIRKSKSRSSGNSLLKKLIIDIKEVKKTGQRTHSW